MKRKLIIIATAFLFFTILNYVKIKNNLCLQDAELVEVEVIDKTIGHRTTKVYFRFYHQGEEHKIRTNVRRFNEINIGDKIDLYYCQDADYFSFSNEPNYRVFVMSAVLMLIILMVVLKSNRKKFKNQ